MDNKYFKYLPSKNFVLTMGSFVFVLGIVFLIFFLFSKKESFTKKDNNVLKIENQTIADFVKKDTDLDGIADWEEALWGTNKNKQRTFNDIPDAIYIENKKKELNIEQKLTDTTSTETDKFAREFFTAYTALKSSGEIDEATINSFSNALGQKIANPNLIDKYTENDVKINPIDNISEKNKYYENIKKHFDIYRNVGLGKELEIINSGLIANGSTGENINEEKLMNIAKAYKEFSINVMETSVPQSLLIYHLKIANNSNNLSISVPNMAKVINDPIIGLSGLSQYQKYSDELVSAVLDLEAKLR